MDGIRQELQNPAWWFSVVAAGLLLNVLSSYVKQWLDGQLESYSARIRESRRLKSEKSEAFTRTMVENPALQQLFRQWEIRYRLRAIHFSVGAGTSLLLAAQESLSDPVRLGFSILAAGFLSSFVTLLDVARRRGKELDEALRRMVSDAAV